MPKKVVALSGGVGGAKFVSGLAKVIQADKLTVIVNTGDDFEHLGLTICPDLDTITYTLAGLANPQTGWGRVGETWGFLETLGELGGPTWFRLGDHDLALHHERTRRLREGQSLTAITGRICQALGVSVTVLPMSDQPVRTIVITDEGELPFQEYFVFRQCEPRVKGFRFMGLKTAEPAPGLLEAVQTAEVVIFCPSNPWVSLDPILAVSGILEKLGAKVVIGVTPIVGGRAIKGPAAKMYRDLGIRPSAIAVAEHYRDLWTGFVVDQIDEELVSDITSLGMSVLVTDTIMNTIDDRVRLAENVLSFASEMVLNEGEP
jgi:LPPG:FO 2-phospho-L-lactate transferase